MAAEHSGVTVTVHERSASAIETELEAGRFDLGCGVLTHASPNLRYERLLSESVSLIVPRRHALAGRVTVSVSELASVPLVLLPKSFDMRQIVDDIFRRSQVRPLVAYEISSISSTLMAVQRSGTATLLTPIVLGGRDSLGLRAIPLRGKVPRIEYGLMSSRITELSPAAQAFAGILREACRAPQARQRPGKV
jgi:LysR family cyn operon transcriptional activator